MKKKLFFLTIGLFLLSCVYQNHQEPFSEITKLVASAEQKGLSLPNPFEIDDSIKSEIAKTISAEDPPHLRFRKVLRYLYANGFLNFDYDINSTLSAQETFEKKRGNCLSYTGLFVSLARNLNVPVNFAYLSEIVDFEEKEGSYVVSSHIAAEFNDGHRTILVDFNRQREDFKLYERIDDQTAYCLFYNNLAVSKITNGELAEAEKILDFLLEIKPFQKEILNNKGVLLIKMGKYEEALSFFNNMRLSGILYQPSLSNGLLVSQILKRKDFAEQFSKELKEFSENDPLILYQKAIDYANENNFKDAIASLKKAIAEQPRNAFLHATLSVLYIKNGEFQKAKQEFRKAKRFSPNLPILEEILKSYPSLAD
ncbi:MAG: tetratricopeptide repeat protein [Acidobacteriota bacterium]